MNEKTLTPFKRCTRALYHLTAAAEALRKEYGATAVVAAVDFLHREHLDAIPSEAKAEVLELVAEVRAMFEDDGAGPMTN